MAKAKMHVELIAHTPEPERLIATAAKLCYSPSCVSDLMESMSDAQVQKFLERLNSMGHESPIEHVSFSFAVEGVSRVLETQLVRHRLASYSIQSGRYVKRLDPEFVYPRHIARIEEAKARYEHHLEESVEAYNDMVDIILKQLIREYLNLEEGAEVSLTDFYDEDRKTYLRLEKEAIEDARYAYPQGLATKIFMTMNARTLMNFLKHRACRRAQDEINQLAWEIRELIQPVAPTLAKAMGPSCATKGKCSEGPMCCGRPYPRINEE